MDSFEFAKTIRAVYSGETAFPDWVVSSHHWKQHQFDNTRVYYHSTDNLEHVVMLLRDREPCNIGMHRLYKRDELERLCGYKTGAYRLSTDQALMPNVAVYCDATVRLRNGTYCNVHVINLIGVALDTMDQPDYQYYSSRSVEELVDAYRRMWRLAGAALTDHPSLRTLAIYNVGGGAFAGWMGSSFATKVFEPAFAPTRSDLRQRGIDIVGFDWERHQFDGGYIPDCLSDGTLDLETTLFVNAWDPWSLIGNGNGCDNSLDGHWGRISNMAVLGWLRTNPAMKFVAVPSTSAH